MTETRLTGESRPVALRALVARPLSFLSARHTHPTSGMELAAPSRGKDSVLRPLLPRSYLLRREKGKIERRFSAAEGRQKRRVERARTRERGRGERL